MAWSSEHAPFITRAALTSAATADNEFAIDCGVLLSEAFEIAGVLRRYVARLRLTVADRCTVPRSGVLRQLHAGASLFARRDRRMVRGDHPAGVRLRVDVAVAPEGLQS